MSDEGFYTSHITLEEYYQGSLYSKDAGFKGFPPKATPEEVAWICAHIGHDANNFPDKCPPVAVVAVPAAQPQPTMLPATGPGAVSFMVLIAFVIWTAGFYAISRDLWKRK